MNDYVKCPDSRVGDKREWKRCPNILEGHKKEVS